MDKSELINKIVNEKGNEAITILSSLIYENDDGELIKLVLEALDSLGEEGKEEIYKIFSDLSDNNEEINNSKIYFLIDFLADNGDKRIIKKLFSMLNKSENDEINLLIYDALAMLDQGEKVIDVLTVMTEEKLDEDSWEVLIMALSHTKSVKALLNLKKIYLEEKDENRKAMILQGIINILNEREELITQFSNDEAGREILKKIDLWLKNNEKNI